MIRIFCLLHVFSVSPVSATATLTALAATTEISAHLLLVGLISLELLGSHNLLELGVILLLGLLALLAHLGELLAHLLGHLGTLATLAHSLAHSLATAEVRTGTVSAGTATHAAPTETNLVGIFRIESQQLGCLVFVKSVLMLRGPPGSTRTDRPFAYTTLTVTLSEITLCLRGCYCHKGY